MNDEFLVIGYLVISLGLTVRQVQPFVVQQGIRIIA